MNDLAYGAHLKALAMLVTCLSLKPLMTPNEVAEFLQLSRSRVYALIRRGALQVAEGMEGGRGGDTRVLGVSVALYVFGEDVAEVFKDTNLGKLLQSVRPSRVAA